jgi:hypothetical protein
MTYRFLPPENGKKNVISGFQFPLQNLPVLSAQFMTAPTGQAREILNLAPAAPPRPDQRFMLQIFKDL